MYSEAYQTLPHESSGHLIYSTNQLNSLAFDLVNKVYCIEC